jgi:hypothetical protein
MSLRELVSMCQMLTSLTNFLGVCLVGDELAAYILAKEMLAQ